MKNAIVAGALAVTVSFAMLAFGFMAGDPGRPAGGQALAESGPQLDRGAIEQIVRDYLIANPEILLEVQTALETKREEEKRVAQAETIRASAETIFNAPYDGVLGNPDASVTVVEFFDYNCSYCKRAMDDMEALLSGNDNVRFVLKEFPILGPDSQQAHIVSMAFRALAPEKYGEFHRRLLGGVGRAGEASAIAVARELGVDEAALRAEMENPAIREAFAETYELANELSITGTPSYVIGTQVVFGALGLDVLNEKIEAAAACPDALC
ncbi:DsbA family protein [Aquibium sp. A9E412]|uniref:DsbA family protein n=1 Tax=Aquibium sp. A9E412 TaxID=2976767 RepID=UPI0025B13DF6|nr:DsbA family protein [Aquibium sp. A9E412]MDN2568008.1 DsbA family protein [Aquibium sp. A9E412]